MMENLAETKLRVRYQETDQMGVVYHANYLVWFEVGRTEMMRERGFSYKDLEARGLLLPVVDIHCKYEYPARYDDPVIVRTKIGEFNRSKIIFSYEVIHQETGRRLAKGESIHLWVNQEMKRVNLKHSFPELYMQLSRLTAKGGE
ncbi:acyl-CoA thioesterase [Thermoactinomyces mirandus]|uniref:Acyl-CoA thioesterase n=1 Tax=Thermoactinomyces mirandus TaxID=2756294 RepID=A0A7W1XRA5_9BACL|nr:thioesterase family protein [Thermoactinomyces mirandus]MBA4601600.1 acyl-CoA thioesterase [Thermoactinomyces mirandus]